MSKFLSRAEVITTVAATIIGVAIAIDTKPGLAVVLLFLGVLALVGFFRAPAWVIPLLFVTLPLEISKKYFPVLRIDREIDGQKLSMLELSRLVLLSGIILFALSGRLSKVLVLGKYQIAKWSLFLWGFCCLQLMFVNPDPHRAVIEIIRLTALVSTMFVVGGFLTSMRRVELALRALLLSATVIAVIGVWQYFTAHFFWNFDLRNYPMTRINVTFADPNILGRYLAVFLVVALNSVGTQLVKTWQLFVGLVAGSASLLFTYSRSNWLAFLLGIFVLWWYSKGRQKGRMARLALAVLIFLPIVFVSIPSLRERAQAFVTDPDDSLGARKALLVTGFEMYKDHPFIGVGWGAFGEVASHHYAEFLPYGGDYVFESHTAMVTVMAELGTVGLLITIMIFKSAWDVMKKILRIGDARYKAYALSAFVALLMVVISGQSEGDMFQDTTLWVFMGILLSLEHQLNKQKVSLENDPARPAVGVAA